MMRTTGSRVAQVGVTLLVAGILAAASPPATEVKVEVAPGLSGQQDIRLKAKDVPPPGGCRLWYPNRKPADQPKPVACAELPQSVPAGAYILHRAEDGRLLRLQ